MADLPCRWWQRFRRQQDCESAGFGQTRPWPENVSQCFPWRRSLSAEGAECQRYSPEDRQVRKRSGQMYNHAAHRNQYPSAQFQ
jgi:hypothetical protein